MAEAAPDLCPTCGTALPPGAFRCPGCGRVLGEQNRCPHCHAIAGVLTRGPYHVCAACGGRRDPVAGTVILEDLGGGARLSTTPPPPSAGLPPAQTFETQRSLASPGALARVPASGSADALAATRREGMVGRGSAFALRLLGVLAVAGAVAAGALAAVVVPGVGGLALAGAAGLLGAGGGTWAFLRARKGDQAAERARRATLEQAAIAAASVRDGSLTATEASVALGIPLREADALLTSMADGSRVAAEIDPEGIVRFEFRELKRRPSAQPMRVEEAPPPPAAVEEVELEAESSSATARERTER